MTLYLNDVFIIPDISSTLLSLCKISDMRNLTPCPRRGRLEKDEVYDFIFSYKHAQIIMR